MRGATLLLLVSLSAASALRPALAKRTQPVVMRTGAVATQWSRYLKALEEDPMRTKMATAALLSGTGDVIAQCIEKSGPFSVRRFLTLVTVNVLYIVPILTLFYAANEWLAERLELKAGWPRTGVQLAFDQLINAPIVIAGFFTSFQAATAIAEGVVTCSVPALHLVPASVGEQLRASYVQTLISNWKIWVLPQLINFAVVPPFARVAFANMIALIWNVVLSIIANAK